MRCLKKDKKILAKKEAIVQNKITLVEQEKVEGDMHG